MPGPDLIIVLLQCFQFLVVDVFIPCGLSILPIIALGDMGLLQVSPAVADLTEAGHQVTRLGPVILLGPAVVTEDLEEVPGVLADLEALTLETLLRLLKINSALVTIGWSDLLWIFGNLVLNWKVLQLFDGICQVPNK